MMKSEHRTDCFTVARKFTLLGVLLVLCISANISSSLAADNHAVIGDAVDDLPLFDAHVHYKEPAWEPFPPDVVLSLMDKNGVAMALVSSTPDDGTIKLWEYAPSRIVPEMRPYNERWGSSNWVSGGSTVGDYIERRIRQYPHEGIGEFHLHQIDIKNDPLLRRIVALAKERDIPLHVHSGYLPVKHLYSMDPDITIIWAHAGMIEPPEVVEEMMETYRTLYADTSFREMDILDYGRGSISPRWKVVLERFSDRFMVGSDTWVNSQWQRYGSIIDTNRQWLAQLTPEAAKRIAYQNAERLFGRKVSHDLIGTR